MSVFKQKGAPAQRKVSLKYSIDCGRVVDDKVVVVRDFEKFLKEHIKVNGKKGNLGNELNVQSTPDAVNVHSELPFSKRYLKYLTKKYLRKAKISEYLRVISTNKHNYEIRYLNIFSEED